MNQKYDAQKRVVRMQRVSNLRNVAQKSRAIASCAFVIDFDILTADEDFQAADSRLHRASRDGEVQLDLANATEDSSPIC